MEPPPLKGPDTAALWRVELYTDKVCSEIRALMPMHVNGYIDNSRKPEFFSSVNVGVNGMPHEVRFQIPGETLDEACANFADAAQKAANHFLEQLKLARAQPKLIVPGAMPPVH